MPNVILAERIEPGLVTTNLGTLSAVIDLNRTWTDQELLRAVRGLLVAYPVLDCRYVPGFWRDRWMTDAAPVESIVTIVESAAPEAATEKAIHAPLDPLQSRPLRVTMIRSGGSTRLIVNMPHLVADGNGVLTTVQELAAQLMGTGRTSAYPMDRSVEQLRVIINIGNILRVLAAMFNESRRVLLVPLLKIWPGSFTNSSAMGLSTRRVSLSDVESTAFAATCKQHGGTVNDGLVAACIAVTSNYVKDGLTGSAYTINLRRFLPHKNPIVANLSGFDTVIMKAGSQSPVERIGAVAKITGEQKNNLPGVGSLLLPMSIFGWMPAGAVHPVGHLVKRFMAWQAKHMGLMTNVGVMDPYLAPFGMTVTDAWMAGPFVPGFPAPFAMATSFQGKLSVSVGTVAGVDPAKADVFAEQWKQSLQAVAHANSPITQ